MRLPIGNLGCVRDMKSAFVAQDLTLSCKQIYKENNVFAIYLQIFSISDSGHCEFEARGFMVLVRMVREIESVRYIHRDPMAGS